MPVAVTDRLQQGRGAVVPLALTPFHLLPSTLFHAASPFLLFITSFPSRVPPVASTVPQPHFHPRRPRVSCFYHTHILHSIPREARGPPITSRQVSANTNKWQMACKYCHSLLHVQLARHCGGRAVAQNIRLLSTMFG